MTESAPQPESQAEDNSSLGSNATASADISGSQADGLDALQSSAEDDAADIWAAAMEEQAAATQAPPPAAPSSPAPSPSASPSSAKAMEFPSLSQAGNGGESELAFIKDIPVQLTVELGRTRMTIKNLLQLGQGSVVELDGLAGEPMDIFVNGFLIAQGEVVVVEDRYGIRLTDIITPSDRLNRLNSRH